MNHSYEFHNFTIVDFEGNWLVFGNGKEFLYNYKYDLIGVFDTNKDAEDFILKVF